MACKMGLFCFFEQLTHRVVLKLGTARWQRWKFASMELQAFGEHSLHLCLVHNIPFVFPNVAGLGPRHECRFPGDSLR